MVERRKREEKLVRGETQKGWTIWMGGYEIGEMGKGHYFTSSLIYSPHTEKKPPHCTHHPHSLQTTLVLTLPPPPFFANTLLAHSPPSSLMHPLRPTASCQLLFFFRQLSNVLVGLSRMIWRVLWVGVCVR